MLAAGVLIVSTAAILIRFAQQAGMPSLTVAAGRLGVAALILAPIVAWRSGPQLRRLSRRDVLLGGLSGAFLAAHFAAWITSLAYTSVASSVALVTTNPLWVGVVSMLIFRERLSAGTLGGIALTLAGGILIFISDSGAADSHNPDPLLGNVLALVGAFTASGYFLVGRSVRSRLSLLVYVWLSYSTAALLLVAAVWASGAPVLGFPPVAYLALLALAIGPQLLGHTSFNWALRYLSATFVAVAILGEPIGSALLAFLIFDERFAPLQLSGFVLLLIGIYLAARAEHRMRRKKAAAMDA